MTPNECAAARKILGWTMRDLAAKARVGTMLVQLFENRCFTPLPETMEKLRCALEAGGIEFCWPGVRLKNNADPAT